VVVYAKPPFGGAEHVLHYLARYTHRVAISNHRLVGTSSASGLTTLAPRFGQAQPMLGTVPME